MMITDSATIAGFSWLNLSLSRHVAEAREAAANRRCIVLEQEQLRGFVPLSCCSNSLFASFSRVVIVHFLYILINLQGSSANLYLCFPPDPCFSSSQFVKSLTDEPICFYVWHTAFIISLSFLFLPPHPVASSFQNYVFIPAWSPSLFTFCVVFLFATPEQVNACAAFL